MVNKKSSLSQVDRDSEGYLVNLIDWSEDLVVALATEENL